MNVKHQILNKTTTALFSVLILLILCTNTAHGFNVDDQKIVNELRLQQDQQEQRLNYIEDRKLADDLNLKSLIEAVDIKSSNADEKQKAYGTAINQITWLVSFFGVLLLLLVTGLGLWHNGEIQTKSKELQEVFEKKKDELEKSAEERIDIMKDKTLLEIQKRQGELAEEYKEKFDDLSKKIDAEMRTVTNSLKSSNIDIVDTSPNSTEVITQDDGIKPTFV